MKVAVVSFAADEAGDALLGVKTSEAGTAAAEAGGGALCFLLCSIQVTMGASSIQMKNNSHFSF
jgi:Na+-transporting NADH:ubiquinone oxidoreductase subunit NqrF